MTDLRTTIAAVRTDGHSRNTRCPAHDDRQASLNVGRGTKVDIVLKCHAGCETSDVLRSAGLSFADVGIRRGRSARRIVATYDYHDELGTLLFQVVRFDPKDFRQRRPNNAGGWTWKMNGTRRVLFGLGELCSSEVFVPEGEKDVLALQELGLPATTNPGGAGKWCDAYTQQLIAAGIRSVVALPDNDDAGRAHAKSIARSCESAGLCATVLALPGLPERGDVTDWLKAGHTRDELLALPKAWSVARASEGPIVALASVLDTIEVFVRRYVVLGDNHAAPLIALWVVLTHALDAFDFALYLHIHSPMPECGKSRLLEVLEALVATPWLTSRVTAAVLMRKIDAQHPTLLLDETDTAFNGDEPYAEALRGALNSGFHREGRASACVGQGAKLTFHDFSTFGPKAIAGIGQLPSTVASRSLPIALTRRTKDEPIEKWRRRSAWLAATDLRSQITQALNGAIETLRRARPDMPADLSDRAEDVLEPLFAIADLAGAVWPERARAAGVRLMGRVARGAQEADHQVRIELLRDIRAVFQTHGNPGALFTKTLLDELAAMEDQPWATFRRGERLDNRSLARLVRPFGVHPAGDIWIDDEHARGYRRAAFVDAFTRYLVTDAEPDACGREKPNNSGPELARGDGCETSYRTEAKYSRTSDEHRVSHARTDDGRTAARLNQGARR